MDDQKLQEANALQKKWKDSRWHIEVSKDIDEIQVVPAGHITGHSYGASFDLSKYPKLFKKVAELIKLSLPHEGKILEDDFRSFK